MVPWTPSTIRKRLFPNPDEADEEEEEEEEEARPKKKAWKEGSHFVQPVLANEQEYGFGSFHGLAGVWTKVTDDKKWLIVIIARDGLGAVNYSLIQKQDSTLLQVKTIRTVSSDHQQLIAKDWNLTFAPTDIGTYQIAYCVPLPFQVDKIKARQDYPVEGFLVLKLKIHQVKDKEWF